MSGNAARPRTTLSVPEGAAGAVGLAAMVVAALIANAETSLVVTMHPSSMPRSVPGAVGGVLLGWLAFAAALRLLGRRPPPTLTTALGLSALARTALLPQMAILPPLARELATVELDLEAAVPLRLSSFTPEAWGLMAAYSVAVIFALWAHAAVYNRGRTGDRFGTGGFLLVFLLAAFIQHALGWGLGRLLG